ncbi:MAG: hypothetical protein ACXVCY_17360 [Pseudobdellovibrionaceae bacterium]
MKSKGLFLYFLYSLIGLISVDAVGDSLPKITHGASVKVRNNIAPSNTYSCNNALCVDFVMECYGTNNRQVANPLDPQGVVGLVWQLPNGPGPFTFAYPASQTVKSFIPSEPLQLNKAVLNYPQNAFLALSNPALTTITEGPVPFFQSFNINPIPNPLPIPPQISAPANIDSYQVGDLIAFRFNDPALLQRYQTMSDAEIATMLTYPNLVFLQYSTNSIPNGEYCANGPGSCSFYGYTGQIKPNLSISSSSDHSYIKIVANFPGQSGYCGGYHSPLMLFFEEKYPGFTGSSAFPLYEGIKKTTWVEPHAPGYFLVLDRNKNHKITERTQLFGENGENNQTFKNGFEALKQLDANHDGWIDKNDPDFKFLSLWQDKNGNGVADDGEVISLKKFGVERLSLQYSEKGSLHFGDRAQIRQSAFFIYKNSKSKKTKNIGQLVDVWLKPLKN